MGKRITFLFFRSLVVMSLIESIHIWLEMMERGDIGSCLSKIGICLVFVIICYIIVTVRSYFNHIFCFFNIYFCEKTDIDISV